MIKKDVDFHKLSLYDFNVTATKPFIVNSESVSINGTSYKGYIKTTYDELVRVLGQPRGGSWDKKTTCEWHIEFEDGTVVTIYDWKVGYTPKDLHKWHIGAKSHKALDYLEEVLKIKPTKSQY